LRYRPLGESGIKASVVAFGAWAAGGWMWGGTDEADAIKGIQAGLDVGMNFIDTAPAYGLGLSEEIVGKAVKGRRDQAIIATKCGLQWHNETGTYFFEEMGKTVRRSLVPTSIRYELEQSLKRLDVDYVDLLQTHWQDPTTPIEDTMKELLKMKEEGKVKAIGISNATIDQLKEYMKYGVVDTDQELFSMLDRKIEPEILPYCREHNVAMLAYSPLAQGLLTGKITPERQFNEGDQRLWSRRFSVENRTKILDMLSKYSHIAEEHRITLAQLAIAWTIAQPGLTHALVGARNATQALENAAAGDVVLSSDELKEIDTALQQYFQSAV
jgi:aryl-alcohol dehydrogenase-like predicted oxidoreductase